MTIKEELGLIQRLSRKTQEKLAQELGVSFPTLNSWLNGRSAPRKKAAERIHHLYLSLTGQNIVPAEVLETKKLAVLGKRKEFPNILEMLLSEPDIRNQMILSLTYNTNRIEGSTLTEPDTAAILFENAALPDKSLTEHLEVKNHEAALNFLFRHLFEGKAINEVFVLRLHAILMNGIQKDAGEYRKHAVRIAGSNVPTANYLKVPELMEQLMNAIKGTKKDVIAHATLIHSRFEQIHPFSDGNGRIGRLLLSGMLLDKNLPPAVIRQENRRFYLLYLNKSQLHHDFGLLENFVVDSILDGFEILERKIRPDRKGNDS